MKILIVGDIYGKAGKNAASAYIPHMKKELDVDLVIANAENTSEGGKSLIKEDYDILKASGVDYITMGNHTFRNKSINEYIDDVNDMVRPSNLIGTYKGKGYINFKYQGKKILLLNLLGETFMNMEVENPFHHADQVLDNNEYDLAIVDFHAEATSEKIVLANHISDRAAIVFGTHTHIQTADERILNGTTAYITDVGMTGVFDSAIGANFKEVTDRIMTGKSDRFKEAEGKVRINAVLVTLYDNTLKPMSIERIVFNP